MDLKERKIIVDTLEIVQSYLSLATLELGTLKKNIDYNDVVFQKEKYNKESD